MVIRSGLFGFAAVSLAPDHSLPKRGHLPLRLRPPIALLPADLEDVKVRLANVDAPERGQRFGDRSKQVLAGMASQREFRMTLTVARSGRIVALAQPSITRRATLHRPQRTLNGCAFPPTRPHLSQRLATTLG